MLDPTSPGDTGLRRSITPRSPGALYGPKAAATTCCYRAMS